MQRWIKRSLIGAAAAITVLGGIAAWAANTVGHQMAWKVLTEQEAAPMKAHMIETVGSQLALDAAQKARLGLVADALREQRNALVGSSARPQVELQALIAGNTFDRTQAQALIAAKVAAVNTQSPALVTAMADFYDSLRPDQQAKLREFMARHAEGHHHGHRDGNHHGHRDGRGHGHGG